MKKSVLFSLILALAVSAFVAMPARAFDKPTSTAELSFMLVFSVAGSTDSAYTAAFGATSIQGLLNGQLRFNGTYPETYPTAKYANVKFYQPYVVIDPSVTACAQKALTVAASQLQVSPSSDGRNAQLVMKVTGDVRLNPNNGGYDGEQNLTIIEVRSLKSLACEAAFYIPQIP